jgi:hypothetical protein
MAEYHAVELSVSEEENDVKKLEELLYLCDTLVDRLESLVLAHVFDHFGMGPGWIVR